MMNNKYDIYYYEEGDLWILKTGEEEYSPFASLGHVIFIGNFRPFQEQVDHLLDLLLLEDGNYVYYLEILRKMAEI